MPVPAREADFPRRRNPHHMIGTYPLIIVGRIHHFYPSARLFLIGADSINHRRGELKIDIIKVHHVRVHVKKHFSHLPFRLERIDNFKGIEQFLQLTRMKIHVGRVKLRPIPHNASDMLHTEILNPVPLLLQIISQLKDIRFRSAVGVQELIDH